MKNQACEPCAKRKVRCDREEPCSNCKRRKQDHCTYTEASPFDRIKRLEILVRNLGGDPDGETQQTGKQDQIRSQPVPSRSQVESIGKGRSRDPVLLEEDGQPIYLESREWQGWLGNTQENGGTVTANHFLTRHKPTALQSILCKQDSGELMAKFPPQQVVDMLWDTFCQRVFPVVHIMFDWELQRLRSALTQAELPNQVTDAEYAFISSVFLFAVVSLSEEECVSRLHQPKVALLSAYQTLCEMALARTGVLCVTDIYVLRALAFYMMAGIDRLSTPSLWSLMGLTIRSAERLGIHRDGTLLGLSPAKTEERRRLWWYLQHLDLVLAVRSGVTSMTLSADWDAKLPLNIEDCDVSPDMAEFPIERIGLTSSSYNLFTYSIIDQQRLFLRTDTSRFELSWQANQSLMAPMKENFIDKLEQDLNKNFIQYCDPIKPLHTLIQLIARSLICGMRLRILHPLATSGEQSEDHRDALLSASIRALEYNIATLSSPSLKYFQWLTEAFFPWHPFRCVLVEVSRRNDESKVQQIWDLLSDLYAANTTLLRLSEDRRKSHAAGLVTAAWKARQSKSISNRSLPKPDFVKCLEEKLSECPSNANADLSIGVKAMAVESARPSIGTRLQQPITPESSLAEQDVNAIFDLDFEDIDWSFWAGIE